MNARCLLAPLIVCLAATTADAHKPSDSYLRIDSGGEQLSIVWDIALKDLEFVIGLDSDQDNRITWGELKRRRTEVAAYALSRLRVSAGDGSGRLDPATLELADLMVTEHSDGGYAVLVLRTDLPGDAPRLEIEYRLLFDVDPTHRGLVLHERGSAASTHVLTPAEPRLTIDAGETGVWSSFAGYVREGVWHIWIGYDHILFLLTLLLPATFTRSGTAWRPVESFRPTFKSVLHIVTVFTVAHSITLWLAVMEYATPPSRFIESTIAVSIIITALNNLRPVLSVPGWAIAFAFGLVHGFGFANVLLDLGTSQTALAASLLGFNVGVELGQLAIVVAFLPIAYSLRKAVFYQSAVFRGGSLAIAGLACVWAVERVFGVEVLGV